MMEVKIWLNDEVEIDLFGQLTAVLRQKRNAEQNFSSEPLTPRATAANPALGAPYCEAQTPEPEDDRPGEPYVPEKSPVVGNITPAAPPAVTPSESEAADALRAFIAAKGVEAAVKLLGEFGVKRAGELAPEQRAAFIGKTTDTSK